MANFKETKDYTFAEFCNMYQKFSIPHFQRPYAWTNKNIQDLWDSIISNEKQYFIGNIVAVKGDNDNSLLIVDGQQRLITISLLLTAIKDTYISLKGKLKNENDKKLIEQKRKLIFRYLKDEDLSQVPAEEYKRLNLGKEEYQKIYNYIVDEEQEKIKEIKNFKKNDNLKRFVKNYKILKSLIDKHIIGSELERLNEILEKVLTLQFILIVCSSDNDIYGIFEGFNSTGLGLSVADLVKNALLRETQNNSQVQKEIESNWNELEKMFENTSIAKFPKFLRHQWISEEGYVTTSHLYKKIKTEKIEGKTYDELLKYSQDLLRDARFYLGIQFKDYEKFLNELNFNNEIKEIFKKFRLLKNEQIYELLLRYYKTYLYNKKLIRPGVLQKILNKLWIFSIRARFISISPSEYERIFADHCINLKSVKSPGDVSKYSNILFDKLKRLVRSKEQFIENFSSDLSYPKDKGIIQLALRELIISDEHEIEIFKPTIEHILPTDPEKWGYSREDIQDFVNKIGNLTLLTEKDNIKLGNETLDEKIKRVYSKSKFKINQEIEKIWKDKFLKDPKSAIEERSKEIAKRVEKIWSF